MANEMEFKIGKLVSMTETKKSKDWTLFTLKFDCKGEEEEFTAFDSVGTKGKGLTLDKLKTDSIYNIGFIDDEKGKSIKWINTYTPKKTKSPTQKTEKTFSGETGNIVNVEFDMKFEKYLDFNIEYIDGMKAENKEINFNHYFGFFIRTHKQELNLTKLVEWIELMFQKEIKEKEEERNKVKVVEM